MIEKNLFFDNGKGLKLCGVISNPTGKVTSPIIILAHGFSTSKNSTTNHVLNERLNSQEISTFRFDFFGHGESEGKFEDITVSEGINDVLHAIRFLKDNGYNKIGLSGSSFGGFCSSLAASQSKDLFCLALKAPVSDYEEVELLRFRQEGIADWKKKGFRIYENSKGHSLKLNYTFFDDLKKNLAYSGASKIRIPTLIVHGDADSVVPISQSKKIAKMIPNCQLKIISGADHNFSRQEDFEEVVKAITDFILAQSKYI